MTFYICAIIITELMMLAMTVHVLRHSGFRAEQKRWYIVTFISIMLCAAAELAELLLDGRGKAVAVPLTLTTAVEFSLTPMLPVFFTGALGMREDMVFEGALLSLNAAAQLVSAPFGWIFYFDETGRYFRGEYYVLFEAFYIAGLVFLVISMIDAGKRFRHRDRSTVIMTVVIMIAGIIPMVFFKIYTDYVAIAICASLCYIYYNDLVQQDAQAALISNQKRISEMQESIISGMSRLIESRDLEDGPALSHIGAFVQALAEDARDEGVYTEQLTDRFIARLRALAPMHDLGKILVSDEILKKPGRLAPEEFEQVKLHTSEGGAVIRKALDGITDGEYLALASDIASYHHERWDGKGYPEGLAGEDIPLSARITAVADVFDALISDRSYRKALPVGEAIKIIRKGAGTLFDPRLAEVFDAHSREFAALSTEKGA